MIKDDPGSPEWKVLWDTARKFANEEKYLLAVNAYAEVYRLKPNIEEANWEYCKILLKVNDFSTAARIISGLIDKDPNNSQYLLAGGAVALHWKNYVTAIDYYGRVLEKDPSGVNSDLALLGLATSLREQGKKELAFRLFEQYSLRHPENSTVIHTLALDAHELGKEDKAKKLYAQLLENPAVEDQVIFQAVQVFGGPGYEKKRSELWQQYLKRHPDYMLFRQELAQYYMENGAFEAALAQLTYLIDNNKNNEEFLLAAGKVCLEDLHRPARALFFYEKYLHKHPAAAEIQQKVADIQSVLANDFLVIAAQEGAEKLWTELSEITSNRQAIYLEMADLLEKKGKNEQVIDVLETLFKHSAPQDDIALRIAQLYHRKAQYRKTLDYLSALTGEKEKTKSYYLMKGDAERHLGLDMKALASFEQGLSFDRHDVTLRTKCLELAGTMGNIDKLKSLFAGGMHQTDTRVTGDFVFAYLDMLSFNFLFTEYALTYNWAKEYFADLPETVIRLDIHMAASLRNEGKPKRAEQLLRQLLLRNILVEDILFRLTENAVLDNNLAAAKSWYQELQKTTSQLDSNFSLDPQGARVLLVQLEILQAEGEYKKGQQLIEKYLTAARKIPKNKGLLPFLVRLEKRDCWLSYYRGELQEAYRKCDTLVDNDPFDPELSALQGIILRKLKKTAEGKSLDNKMHIAGIEGVTRQLAVAVKELEYREYAAARKHAAAALDKYPDSLVGKAVWAELMVTTGTSESAVAALSKLIRQFPEELYFQKKRIEVEARRGMYEQGLALLKKEEGAGDSIDTLAAKLTTTDSAEELLTLARLLWGDKQQEKALQIYQQLLEPTVEDLLVEKFTQKQIAYHYLTRENSFWNSMMLLLRSEPDVVAELMEPQFLLDNRDNEAAIIVSDLFEKYSWQKLIASEYTARKAIFDRNYYYAEQSYKRLSKEDSPEGMSDLAAIYGKIGKYRKEAQVYEAMQKSGTTTPDLEKSIARNTLQISPQSVFTVEYEEKNGRDGHIDVARTTVGTSFWLTPDLDKDVRLLYANNRFESMDTDGSTGSNYLYAVATYEFTKAYELILGGGAEKINDNSNAGFQYEVELKGQLDDYVNGYVSFEKRQVYDTIEAIQQQITYQSFETGLSIETPIGLSFGGDVRHRFYDDGNGENRFHGYSSYSIFGESLQVELRYDYQYLTNDDENKTPGVVGASAALPYWSPSFFTEHRINLHFQHDFLGYQQGTKKSMSYYAIDSAIGLEENENISFTTNFNIFLEMSPHFLLKGNFILSRSDDFDDKGLFMSLHYRW